MPPRKSNTTGQIHKKQRPVSTISSKETSLLPTQRHEDSLPGKVRNSITWGQTQASLPYHEEEYNRTITIPHPRYHPTPEKGYEHIPDTLYGVPVLGDQVEFAAEQPRRRSSLKGIFGKVVGKREDLQTSSAAEGMSYPMELVGMTVADKQNLASQARQRDPSPFESTNHHHDHHHHHHTHRQRKSVTWDPELGSITTSSSTDIPETTRHSTVSTASLLSKNPSGSSGDSIASDKTVWPFARKTTSLSGGRGRKSPSGKDTSSFPVTAAADGESMIEDDDEAERAPAFKGFEFTPRQYIPLWTPSADVSHTHEEQHHTTPPAFALPTTPPAQQSRHRRSFSIFKPHWKSPSSPQAAAGANYPPAFMDSQLSPSLTHTPSGSGDGQAWSPPLPPSGSAKVYTPRSPYNHSIASFGAHQELQKDLGTPTGKWSRVDFGNGGATDGSTGGGSAPSRTLMYAAEDWLRTL